MSEETRAANLVETDWLEANLGVPGITLVDASWYLPAMNRDPWAEYRAAHIPGAVFFDIDRISDQASDLPHMLASPVAFSSAVRKLGIGDGGKIIVYDGVGLMSAARVWWMFKVMGASDVAILNGGLPKWRAEDRPLDDRMPNPVARHFTARQDNTAVRDKSDLARTMTDKTALVLDARPKGRFDGTDAEPRPGLRSGHIPGSANVPFTDLLGPDRTVLPNDALRARFEAAGWQPGRPVITTCGSGVTAAVLTFALTLLGEPLGGLYDGSWAEWGEARDVPVATA